MGIKSEGYWFNTTLKNWHIMQEIEDNDLRDLKTKLTRARNAYANCGCKIYREEMIALSARIKEIEDGRTGK